MHSPISSIPLKECIINIRERIGRAAEKTGRNGDEICLVAITKNVPAEIVLESLTYGVTDIGESRVQEAILKKEKIRPSNCRAHLVGSLQTNKAKKAVEIFDVIQSVDRPRLAAFLDRAAAEAEKTQRCLIEVKISPEETKSGIPLKEAPDFIRGFKEYSHLRCGGLMTIAPHGLPIDETRAAFRDFKTFFDSMKVYFEEPAVLSMGMTDDFEIAVEEGSTMVRIGRGIYGERN
ncbi:MAG: YggS family pyridoxal phosphate-dependent enzyme [Elusimicrobia bacterium]|nr:YggS family pyridoxal phosphate-dependent enzyme [Candidatus Obscuribacterium magneticum]